MNSLRLIYKIDFAPFEPGIILSISPKGVLSLAQGVFFDKVENSPGISIGKIDISLNGAKSVKFVNGSKILFTKSI